MKSLPIEKCQAIAAWWTPETTYVQAAKHWGIDKATVRRALKRAGAFVERNKSPYSIEDIETISKMLAAGKNTSQIAEQLQRPYHGVQRYISDNFKREKGRPIKGAPVDRTEVIASRGFGNSSKYLSDSSFMKVNL